MKKVSIIVPCYNEESTITKLLDGIRLQSFPVCDMEVVIADGFSKDLTREKIEEYKSSYPDLKIQVVDNMQKTIPAALNSAIRASQGTYIIRLDAHSIPNADYVRLCIAALDAKKADNVGGVWLVQPGDDSFIARSIAVAGSHPLGVGDASYRYATQAAYVDTVPFGAYRKDLLERIGWYDESLLSNEDYEFNVRIRKHGGKVWMDPAIRSIYFARGSLAALARQYWRYGFWKGQMLRRYPGTIRWRQALPPLFVGGIAGLTGLSFLTNIAFYALLMVLAMYFLILIASSVSIALQKKYLAFIMGVPLSIACMHFCWGSGFIWSMISGSRTKTRRAD